MGFTSTIAARRLASAVTLAGAVLGLVACGTLLSVDEKETTPLRDSGGETAASDGGNDAVTDGGGVDSGSVGPPAKVVFVTTAKHDGALNGFAGGDEICAAEAASSGLTGKFLAYLQTERGGEGHPAMRLPNHGWSRVDGKVAFDGNPKNAVPKELLNLTADAAVLAPGEGVWTGVSATFEVSYYCALSGPDGGPPWTVAGPIVGTVGWGDPNSKAAWQRAGGRDDCSAALHFYCFEE